MKNLWKVDYPPQDPELRWEWIYQVEDHLFGTREMQNELLKAWGFSYTRKDRRKKPLRDKMGGISLRARDREFKILQLRSMNLSFRQIGAQLGISHVAAYKRYWWAMDESLFAEQRREGCLIDIRDLLQGWIRYYEKLDSTVSEKGMSGAYSDIWRNLSLLWREKNVLGVAANIRFSMDSGGKAARPLAHSFREFSGAQNWPESALESPRSSTRVQRSFGFAFCA